MTQQNIAYNWNVIHKSTLTHALLLVVLRPSLPTPRSERLNVCFVNAVQGTWAFCSDGLFSVAADAYNESFWDFFGVNNVNSIFITE